MEFLYTIDPLADEPIMTLFGEIDGDESEQGVIADRFCRELMFLDTQNKSKINVWINSGGGSVAGGMHIFNTILKTKTKVDTHNVGMAASIAGPIFLAGRNRYMMDNAVFMMHPVSGGDDKAREVFEKSVNTMLSSRTFLNTEKIKKMMDETTWINAADCENIYGLCEIEYANTKNIPRKRPDTAAPKEAWKAYQNSINEVIKDLKPKNKMADYKAINNKLDLNEDASIEATGKAIDAIKNKVKEGEDKLSKMKNDLDEAENKFNKLKEDFDKATNEIKTATEAKNKAEAEKKESEADAEISNAVKIGKIANKAETIALWKNNYLANPEGTKAMIAEIPLNKKGAAIPTSGNDSKNEAVLTNAIGSYMAEVRNKIKA